MVFVGGLQEEEREDSKTSEARFVMAMGPERSRSLHNFSLPCLKWGSQRQLRCVKVDDPGASDGCTHFRRPLDRRSQPSSSRHCTDSGGPPRRNPESEKKRRSFFEPEEFGRSSSRFRLSTSAAAAEIGRRSAVDCDGGDGIEAVRKKLMLDLQSEMDKMKFAVLRDGSDEIEPPPRAEAPPMAEARPWNLRNRRAACKEPNANVSAKNQRIDEGNCSFSPAKEATKSPARWNDVGGVKRPREKFSVSLSKQEIEEDFIAIIGIRPPRRPKKRPRCIQRQLDTLFPGLWLSEVTPDMYKVNEKPEGGKS